MSNITTLTTTDDNSDRLIRGSLLKFVDGVWDTRDGETIPAMLLVMDITKGLQRWAKNLPVETIMQKAGEPLPDVELLNEAIPQEEWEPGIDGKPRAPWQLNHVVYLVDPKTATSFTFSNSTTGARIATEKLKERIETMRRLRGESVTAVVSLGLKAMKTQFGQKQRPDFVIEKWFGFGGGEGAAQIEHKPDGGGGAFKKIAPPTLAEEVGDEVPF
jgi:hypothetical protein